MITSALPGCKNRYIAFPLSPPLCIWHICITGKRRAIQTRPLQQNRERRIIITQNRQPLCRVTREQADRINFYLAQDRHHLYNEDVFWATEATGFIYPEAMEAIRFAFDKYPAYCYKLTGGQLPFDAIHGINGK